MMQGAGELHLMQQSPSHALAGAAIVCLPRQQTGHAHSAGCDSTCWSQCVGCRLLLAVQQGNACAAGDQACI